MSTPHPVLNSKRRKEDSEIAEQLTPPREGRLFRSYCGFVFMLFLRLYRQQRAMLRQRVEVIANMNHHVRNALQVIEFNSYSTSDQENLGAIKSSVNRIQWALRELLPKL